jgi:hypothetical protein
LPIAKEEAMKLHEGHESLMSLSWIEEFGVDWPDAGVCMCGECTGEAGADLGPSRASIVSATSALCR